MLGDEGEGDSDDSDPVLVTGEASVAGSAAVSAGPSSFSHSTVAPGSSGAFRAPPGRLRDQEASLGHRQGYPLRSRPEDVGDG